MKAVIVIGNNYEYNPNDFTNAYVIACDKGAAYCLKNNIKMDIAIGDFDSISSEELNVINSLTKVIKLNPIKDETDTLEAINLCINYDEIVILGGISGSRIEHFYANLLLLEKYNNVKIKDNNSLIFTADKNIIINKDEYKYISIFSLFDDNYISLKGFKYNLCNYKLNRLDPLGISNEIIELGEITSTNRLLIILSKDDNR